jgi:hypothetical protein
VTDAASIEAAILAAVTTRGAGRSVCPSEVARALAGPDEKVWRLLMHPIREAARRLSSQGRIAILRKGRVIAPQDVRGVIRLSLPAEEPS